MEKSWYALYVKSRHEFITNRELNKKGITTYLPSVRKLRQWKDRKKYVDFPLFPGYVFVNVRPSNEQFLNIVRTPGAVRLLASSPGYPVSISKEEIESLKILVSSGSSLDIYPHLKEGMMVRVKRGPLNGAIGTLVRKEDNYMIFVNIQLLGRSVGVRVYADDVEEA